MKIQTDKIAHCAVSGILVLIIYSIWGHMPAAVIITLTIGLWKEILDGMLRDKFSLGDIIADVTGIIIATGCLIRII